MAQHAGDMVESVRRVDGVLLDYSVASLELVDRLLGRFYEAGDDPGRMSETIFVFGSYIGEVIVRQADGSWVTVAEDHPMGGGWPLVELGQGELVNPIGKAFKRVRNGSEDSITHFYVALLAS